MRIASGAVIILLPALLLLLLPPAQAVTVETFVSPDSSFSALSAFIGSANESVLLATYTFTSPEIAALLVSKASDGVSVSVISDKSPAGGMPESEKSLLCALSLGGAAVLLYDGEAPYMHAKYVVRDGKDVLLASENVGYDGFDPAASFGNRGWGVAVYDAAVASEFSDVFSSDFSLSVPPECEGADYDATFRKEKGAYTPRFAASTYEGQEVSVVFSP
ncbi:MAG: phospholipase D-like domain-containing protein, partial [Candidatus Aenigmatarchaeota archaeon]